MKAKDKKDERLSHSSAGKLLGCEQRYWHYKVNDTPYDPDYDDNQDHFVIGKAFHYVLEETKYKTPLKWKPLFDKCKEDFSLKDEDRPLLKAMLLKFLDVWREQNLEVVAVEFEIDNGQVTGFIDAIVRNSKGDWWILDLKTARTVRTGLAASLPRDRQLNLYAYFADRIGGYFGLDHALFKGAIYWVTTKSGAKCKLSESVTEFIERLRKLTRSVPFYVDIKDMDPATIYNTHMSLYERSIELRAGHVPIRNYDNCFSYFKPCPYWSKCHNKTYSEASGEN